MNKTVLMMAIAVCFAVDAQAQQSRFYLHDGDRVVFYGDSITDQRNYTMMIETYVVTRYPKLNVAFTNSGWGGDRVTGGGGGDIDLRLKRDVTPYNPTVVTIMLGMNDGGYKAATEESDKAFFDGFRHIAEVLKRDDPQARITAIEPSPYDDVTRTPAFPVAGGIAYNDVLLSYGRWIGNFAKENNLRVVDANTDFVQMLERANKSDPDVAKQILNDHIHPTFGGALMIGEAVLKSWGAEPVVAAVAVRVDGANVKVDRAEHAAVNGLLNAGGTIHWTEIDDALPLPFKQWQEMWGAGPTVGLVIGTSDITEALNRETLRVSGLKVGVYSLRIDGTSVGTFNDDEFSKGVNLAAIKTPMSDQAMTVYQLTDQIGSLHYARWRQVEVPFGTLATGATAIASIDALEASVVEQRRVLAVPKPHAFEIVALH